MANLLGDYYVRSEDILTKATKVTTNFIRILYETLTKGKKVIKLIRSSLKVMIYMTILFLIFVRINKGEGRRNVTTIDFAAIEFDIH